MIFLTNLKEFFAEPTVYFLATRDTSFTCDVVRCVGLKVTGHATIQVYIYAETAEHALRNLRDNGLIALSVTAPFTHESYQFKGRQIEIRQAREEEREFVGRYLEEFEALAVAQGLDEGLVLNNLPSWPAYSIEIEVEQIFEQTPKTGAGKLLTAV